MANAKAVPILGVDAIDPARQTCRAGRYHEAARPPGWTSGYSDFHRFLDSPRLPSLLRSNPMTRPSAAFATRYGLDPGIEALGAKPDACEG